jgi:hypothetical protein
LEAWARRWVWALPVWGVLLALSTLTHQPDYKTDFQGYAEYVTTDHFLASHLVGSILGASLGIVGVVALVVLLATTEARRIALIGLVAFVVGQVINASAFGVAAFFQPAVGDAYLGGQQEVAESINEDVYGTAFFATVGMGLLLWIIGVVQLGRALRRSGVTKGWGIAFAIAGPIFALAGLAGLFLQPIAGFVMAAAGAATALG